MTAPDSGFKHHHQPVEWLPQDRVGTDSNGMTQAEVCSLRCLENTEEYPRQQTKQNAPLRAHCAAVMPAEVVAWAAQYQGFLTSVRHADPAIEQDDLLHDLYVIFCEKSAITLKDVADKYHLRKLGGHWVPEQPNSNWSDWDMRAAEAESAPQDVDEQGEQKNTPDGLVADTARLAGLLYVGRRRGQQIRQSQLPRLAAQVQGLPDCTGQLGLFADAALGGRYARQD
ncbi:MAG: hypothetical protein ACYCZJ_10080 [Sulfuriferula sp.]